MTVLYVLIAGEGLVDVEVLRRLVEHLGLAAHVQTTQTKGKGYIDKFLHAYNEAARAQPWIVVRDLDDDGQCPGELARRLLPNPAGRMVFRIAVRAVDAWLLADTASFADYFSIPASLLPRDPEAEPHSKMTTLKLLARSRRREVRETCVDQTREAHRAAPGYAIALSDFSRSAWYPEAARQRARSLDRAMIRMNDIATDLRANA